MVTVGAIMFNELSYSSLIAHNYVFIYIYIFERERERYIYIDIYFIYIYIYDIYIYMEREYNIYIYIIIDYYITLTRDPCPSDAMTSLLVCVSSIHHRFLLSPYM